MKFGLNIFLVLTLAISNTLAAQQKKCDENIAEINTLALNADYDLAYEKYTALDKKCLSSEDAFYQNMERVLISKTVGATNDEQKQAFVDQLLEIYTTYDYVLPKNTYSNKVRMATALQVNRADQTDKIYKYLDEAFAKDRENFNNADMLYVYFDLYFKKVTADKSSTDYSALITKRDEILGQLTTAKENSKTPRPYNIAVRAVNKLSDTVLNCDRNIAHYTNLFEARKTDVTWLANTSRALLDGKCTADSLFIKVAKTWYNLKVSEKSAANLAMAEMRNNNQKESIKYYEEAASLANSSEAKADYYYTLARQLMVADKYKVLEYAKKALIANPTMGKAYLMMADVYANWTDCGAATLEKKLLYYAASDIALQAGVASPSLAKIAAKKSEQYLKLTPSSSELKAAKMAGKTVKIGCGLNLEVSVPKK